MPLQRNQCYHHVIQSHAFSGFQCFPARVAICPDESLLLVSWKVGVVFSFATVELRLLLCWIKWSDYISDFAGSRPDVGPAELSEIAAAREVFRDLIGLLPLRLFPEGKLAGKYMEKINIRGSMHNAQIMSSSSLNQLLDFVFMTRVACPPQNAFNNCMLCKTW